MNAAVEQLLDKPAPAVSAVSAASLAAVAAAAAAAAPAALIDEPSIARAMKEAQHANRPVLEVLAETADWPAIGMLRHSPALSTTASSPAASLRSSSRTSPCCHREMPPAATASWCTRRAAAGGLYRSVR